MNRDWTGILGGPDLAKGQDLAEYAILLGAIALVVIVAISVIGVNFSQVFVDLADGLPF